MVMEIWSEFDICGGNFKSYSHLKDTEIFCKAKHIFTLWPSNLMPGYILKQKDLFIVFLIVAILIGVRW